MKRLLICAHCGGQLTRGNYMIALDGAFRGQFIHRQLQICRAIETEREWRKLALEKDNAPT